MTKSVSFKVGKALTLLAGVISLFSSNLPSAVAQQSAGTVPAVAANSPTTFRGLPDFADLVEQVAPAVVNITVSSRDGRRRGSRIPGAPSPRPQQPQQGEGDAIPFGGGSGFLISPDGYLLTNHHVVFGADEIRVTLADKREFKGKLIGSDQDSDVAVVKIEATGLPTLRIGDVEKTRVGEWVIAIGSPFGLDQTVTKGIVSAKNRDIGNLLPFIQTDAAVNQGNSGGPLMNSRGEVIGINSIILAPTGGFQGISLAIPIDEAIRVSESIRSVGRMVRGRLGVGLDEVTKEVAEALGLPKAAGAAITTVEAGTPADKAGIKVGDVILQYQKKQIEKPIDLRRMVGATKPGTNVNLQVYSQGKTREVQAVLGELNPPARVATAPSAAGASEKPIPSTSNASNAVLGLTVQPLTEARKRDTGLTFGVMIETVVPNSPAANAGLQKGDVIQMMNQQEVREITKFNDDVAKLDRNKPVALLVWRDGRSAYVAIRPTSNGK